MASKRSVQKKILLLSRRHHAWVLYATAFVIATLLIPWSSDAAQGAPGPRGFFHDLSPLIGKNGRVRGIAPNAAAFTGYAAAPGRQGAFVWTRSSGYKELPPPEKAENARGLMVRDDGKVVAGLATIKGIVTEGTNSSVDGLVVWGQSEFPVFSASYGVYGAMVTGISPDGSVVVGYSTLGRYEQAPDGNGTEYTGHFNGFKVSDGVFYHIPEVYPQGPKANGNILALGSDGTSCLMGEPYFSGKYIRGLDGKKRREFTLGKVPVDLPAGYNLDGYTFKRASRVFEWEVQAINADGSIGGGQLLIWENSSDSYRYFPVYWDTDGEIRLIDPPDPKYSFNMEYRVSAVSDDGNVMLLHKDDYVALWRKEKGVTPLSLLFQEYGIDAAGANPRSVYYAHMSRDGKCISGSISYGKETKGGQKLLKPFVACFEGVEPLPLPLP